MLIKQGQEQAIIRPEIMAPFGNAMRLVDCEQGDLGFLKQPPEALGRRPFRRDIEKVELPVPQCIPDRARIFANAGQRARIPKPSALRT